MYEHAAVVRGHRLTASHKLNAYIALPRYIFVHGHNTGTQRYRCMSDIINMQTLLVHIPNFCLFIFTITDNSQYGTARGHGCLGEITVWEEQRGDERPDVQHGGDPLRADAHPDGCPANIHQLRLLRRSARPASQKHGRVHACEGEDEVEEGVGIAHGARFGVLDIAFACLFIAK